MEKIDSTSLDITEENIKKLKDLFPNAVTEGKIDFDVLRTILGDEVETEKEKYQFTWPGKVESIRIAQTPSSSTLRPVMDKSKNWETTNNLYIEGDNLEVLKQLQKTYYGRINAIYIDPPYNTGSNLIYKNDFSVNINDYLEQLNKSRGGIALSSNTKTNGRFHSNWCSMIYSRILLARNLLRDDGIICITIDDSEINTLTTMMDEVFGEENHLATIIIKNNPSGRSTVTGASISHEYALFYGKTTEVKLGRLPRNEKQISRYKESDDKGQYEWVNFRKHGGYKEDAPSMYYPIYIKSDLSAFRIPKLRWNDESKEYDVLEKPSTNEIISLPIDENGRARRWKWGLERALSDKDEMTVRLDRDRKPAVYIKSRMKDEGMLPLTVWDEKEYSSTEYGTNYLIKLFDGRIFDYPKSIYAVIDCLRISSDSKNAIILDFFSGSGTTAEAVFKLNKEDGGNRSFIMVQLPEMIEKNTDAYKAGYRTICDIGEERIRRAGEKIKKEWEEKNTSEGLFAENRILPIDIGFKVFKLDSTNIIPWDNETKLDERTIFDLNSVFKADRTRADVLYEIMLKYGIFNQPVSEIEVNGKIMFRIGKRHMIVCLEDNITTEDITAIGNLSPRVVVFKEEGFATDNDKINAEYNLKKNSVEDVKCI